MIGAQVVVSGLLFGGVYALVGVGLTLIFGVLDVANFAHGEFLMLAMYLGYFLSTAGLGPYASLPLVVVAMFGFGLVVERMLIRPTLGAHPAVQVFVTLGLSVALENVAQLLWSPDFRSVHLLFSTQVLPLGGLVLSGPRVVIFLATLLIWLGLHLFLHRTWLGKAIRALSHDREVAQMLGVDVPRVYAFTFGLGSALAGIAGCLLLPIYPVYPTVGFPFVVVAFVAVVMGGLGNVSGAILSGFLIGLLETLTGFLIGPSAQEAAYFAIFVLVLVFWPTGIFQRRARTA